MPEATPPLLRLVGIGLGRGERPLDLELGPGEALVLVAPAGTTATAVLRIAAGLRLPAEGERWAAAVPAAYVFEEGGLVSNASVRENVRVPLLYQGLAPAAADARTTLALARFGLTAAADRRPAALGAEGRHLTQYARAAALDARLHYLENPLAGLSEIATRIVGDWVEERRLAGSAFLVTRNDPTAVGAISVHPWRR